MNYKPLIVYCLLVVTEAVSKEFVSFITTTEANSTRDFRSFFNNTIELRNTLSPKPDCFKPAESQCLLNVTLKPKIQSKLCNKIFNTQRCPTTYNQDFLKIEDRLAITTVNCKKITLKKYTPKTTKSQRVIAINQAKGRLGDYDEFKDSNVFIKNLNKNCKNIYVQPGMRDIWPAVWTWKWIWDWPKSSKFNQTSQINKNRSAPKYKDIFPIFLNKEDQSLAQDPERIKLLMPSIIQHLLHTGTMNNKTFKIFPSDEESEFFKNRTGTWKLNNKTIKIFPTDEESEYFKKNGTGTWKLNKKTFKIFPTDEESEFFKKNETGSWKLNNKTFEIFPTDEESEFFKKNGTGTWKLIKDRLLPMFNKTSQSLLPETESDPSILKKDGAWKSIKNRLFPSSRKPNYQKWVWEWTWNL